MADYVVVDQSGTIVNRVTLDDPAAWPVPEGHTLVAETSGAMEIGGTYIGSVYTPPAAPPPVSVGTLPSDANARLDAGINASIAAADAVRNSIHAIPSGFTAANFQAFLVQAKILSDAFVAMLEAQQTPAPPP